MFAGSSGDLWFGFGCADFDLGTLVGMNDLWQFQKSTSHWIWRSGCSENAYDAYHYYGPVGEELEENQPAARYSQAAYMDREDNLWIFGGYGWIDMGSGSWKWLTTGYLNDLWRYSIARNRWTWVSGCYAASPAPAYGTKGVFSLNNFPGGRGGAAMIVDSDGSAWVGYGYGWSSSSMSWLNDFWQWKEGFGWAWHSGSTDAGSSAQYNYGTLDTPSVNNAPPGRTAPAMALDHANNLFLYGGTGYISYPWLVWSNTFGDLWRLNKFLRCSAGQYKASPAENACSTCPAGTSSVVSFTAGISACLCPIGKAGKRGMCTQCPAGTYSDVQGLTACKNCPAGVTGALLE